MTATNINESCSTILNNIINSALNYSCQETPYSIYITIRKSWSKQNTAFKAPDRQAQQIDQDLKVVEIKSLNNKLGAVKADLETTNKMNDELKIKIETAVVEADRRHIETERMLSRSDDENRILKNSIETCTSENEKLKGELKNLQKVLKSKEKEICNLETFKHDNQEALKNAKSDGKEQKTAKEMLLKQMKVLEKKIVELQKNKYS